MTDLKIIIGKNFGDEGKGLAVDYFCGGHGPSVVVKHNGGGQAGHTVHFGEKRFVFHQLSSGSFHNAATFWADTYYPDLYKLDEEAESFRRTAGFIPEIFADRNTPVTYIDDILINQMLELNRGNNRHGSCGMGINESWIRTNSGFRVTVFDCLTKDRLSLFREFKSIRQRYTYPYIKTLGLIKSDDNDYIEMLFSDTVLMNYIDKMKENADRYVAVAADTSAFLKSFSSVIFEAGQGLLLDQYNLEYAPNLTTSRTGLHNPLRIINENNLGVPEVVYVSRTYVTRHGAGKLACECPKEELGLVNGDKTNVLNEWQGKLRYAPHESVSEFVRPVKDDLRALDKWPDIARPKISLFLTHVNETDGKIKVGNRNMEIEEFAEKEKIFARYYVSDSVSGKETKIA